MSIAEKFATMEYGPAPGGLERGADMVGPPPAAVWTLHSRDVGKAGRRKYFDTSDPSTGEKLASVAQGSAADVDAAVKAAREAFPEWQALGPHARARYLYALARQVQKHSRRLAVLETMDNGKPIRESRDIDIPLVARHFYHHAGWAQILAQEFPDFTACGVVGQIIPVEFSAADAGVEDCACPGNWQHGGAEAGGIYSADAHWRLRKSARRSGCQREW